MTEQRPSSICPFGLTLAAPVCLHGQLRTEVSLETWTILRSSASADNLKSRMECKTVSTVAASGASI